MAQSTVKLAFSTLLGILGWHGVFLLFLIIALKLFLWEPYQESNISCPCTWNVAYGTIMFLFPSLTSYTMAVFAYFRQDSNSAPWMVLKKFYVIKYSCPYYDERTEWDFHADHCIKCRQLRRDWSLVKIAVSAVFSLLYPLVWLSLSFLQTAYYVCAHVGPRSDILQNVCDVTILKPDDYNMAYGLAAIRSRTIGSILFVCTLFFVGVFVILYGEMKSYLSKKFDWDPSGKGASNNLQVQVSIQPGPTSGSAETASLHSNRDTPVAMDSAAAENGRPSPQAVNCGNRAITINLSNVFAETLQGCLQDGAWQGIDICCTQQEESGSRHGSYTPFRQLPRSARIQQQQAGQPGYESLPSVT